MNPGALRDYFATTRGHGILATADAQGRVNQAVFARPQVLEDGTLAFIMPARRTHHNLQENPHASYLFLELGPGYQGKRLYLTKIGEEQDTERLYALRRRSSAPTPASGPLYLVLFRVDQVLPLIGDGTR